MCASNIVWRVPTSQPERLACAIWAAVVSLEIPMQPLLGADGAGSLLRRRLAAQGLIESEDVPLEHGYKELSIPAGPGGAALCSSARRCTSGRAAVTC